MWVRSVLTSAFAAQEAGHIRFNPKARLDTRRMGDAGRSGGGRAGRAGGLGGGMPIPGGVAGGGIGGVIVGVIVVAISMWMGGGSSASGFDTSRMADTGRYENCQTGEDANDDPDCARVAVENSLYDYWSDTLPDQSGTAFEGERQVETFSGGVGTGCGE